MYLFIHHLSVCLSVFYDVCFLAYPSCKWAQGYVILQDPVQLLE